MVSTDGGRTIRRYPTLIPSSGGLLGGAATVADPRRPGHFAIVTSDASGALLVYRSNNGGKRWALSGRIAVPGRTPSKMWLDWSAEGVLGIGWRGALSDGRYGFYGAVSYDEGATFTVRRISTVDSPRNSGVWVAGDDTSAIWLTKDRFYATWGDWRTGSLHVFWGGFALRR